jgi:hypothetical protein
MGLRWDWLQPVTTVPCVPALGLAHQQAITPGLFDDVIEIAGTGRFLPHDKDRRWADRKGEHVLAGAITQEPGLVLIPTFSTRRECVKVHVYSQDPRAALDRGTELGRRLCEQHDARRGRLVWFPPPGSDPDPVAACTRIQMRTFGPGQPARPRARCRTALRAHRTRPLGTSSHDDRGTGAPLLAGTRCSHSPLAQLPQICPHAEPGDQCSGWAVVSRTAVTAKITTGSCPGATSTP